jgi:hypothetical protein
MSIKLLSDLNTYYQRVTQATLDPSKEAPTMVNFIPAPEYDLESMIWVLTYAIFLHTQEALPSSERVDYKKDAVDANYGTASYKKLVTLRRAMFTAGTSFDAEEVPFWLPDDNERHWFQRAMRLVSKQYVLDDDGKIQAITFDSMEKLCQDFITD